MPATVLLLQLIANELGQKRSGQPTVNLALNLLLLPARFRFIQFHGQTAERLQHPAEAGSQTVQLFAGKGSRVFHHAQMLASMDQSFLGGGSHSRLGTAAGGEVFSPPSRRVLRAW